MTKWVADNLAKVLVVALFVALLLGGLALKSCGDARTARVRTDVATGQADAATASGVDAVAVVGNRADADAAADALTRENDGAIRNAQGADAGVSTAVRDAGIAALCRRPAYARDPRCA